jgi:GTP cyclohydrolase III
MIDYTANYQINHGVSNGFALKINKIITAEKPLEAFKEAREYAEKLAQDYMTNIDGVVTVKMTLSEGSSKINLIDILRSTNPNISEEILDWAFPNQFTYQAVDTLISRIAEKRI